MSEEPSSSSLPSPLEVNAMSEEPSSSTLPSPLEVDIVIVPNAPGLSKIEGHLSLKLPNAHIEGHKSLKLPNAPGLSQIEGHPLLKLMLKDMENQAAAIARKIERKETRTFVVKNEIYQLLTFYVVFQGVVLTAVAQASALKCRHWWAPFTLSLIASVLTFVGVYQKLETFRQVKNDFENERFNSSVNGLNFSLFCALFESLLYVSVMQET
jgi:hypothetical protein